MTPMKSLVGTILKTAWLNDGYSTPAVHSVTLNLANFSEVAK